MTPPVGRVIVPTMQRVGGVRGQTRMLCMIQAKQELLQALVTALADLAPESAPVAAFESPKQAAHGDFAITAAMPLARTLKKNPREVAAALVAAL